MPCCPHCIEYFDESDGSLPCCGGCGHPVMCPPGCRSFEEAGGAVAQLPDIEEEDLQSERTYRAGIAAQAAALGRTLRETRLNLGPEHPDTILARLDLFDLYVDPESSGNCEETNRVVACANRLLSLEPVVDGWGGGAAALVRFRLRLARIYLDVHSTELGDALARKGLSAIADGQANIDDALLSDLGRLAWTCYETRQLLDVAEDCYRRVIGRLQCLGRDYLDPLECLQQVLLAAGRTEEAGPLSAQVRALRTGRDAGRRARFTRALNALRHEWEWLDRRQPARPQP